VSSLPGPALVDPAGGSIDAVATGRFLRAAIGHRNTKEHVYRIDSHHDWVTVHTSGGAFEVDRVVIAAGRGALELASQVDLYLPTELAHHAKFTFRLKDPEAKPPCWLDKSQSWRKGITSYQHVAGPGLWSIGLNLPPEDEEWERGRYEVAEESRELVRTYVREELVGVADEIVEEIHCDSPALLGDGIHVATEGPVTVVWGANLFKHAPAIGQTLANAAINDMHPQVPRTEE
jgi:sarcosine oxidase